MYQYRFGQSSDLPWLDQAVAAGAWESMTPEQRMVVPPGLAAWQGRTQLRQVLGLPGTALLIATVGGQPVGYLLVAIAPDSSTDEPTGHLLDFWVVPQHRRRGVGSGLLVRAERWLAAQGLRKVKLWGGLHNQSLLAFAERRGFQPAGLIGIKDL
ncbi:MAG: GNAT family N-acetyltransferase [Bacillota bacterium]